MDIWAVGCIFFELVTGARVFNEDWDVRDYGRGGRDLAIPKLSFEYGNSQEFFENTLCSTLHRQWSQRPTASDLLSEFQSFCNGLETVTCHFARETSALGTGGLVRAATATYSTPTSSPSVADRREIICISDDEEMDTAISINGYAGVQAGSQNGQLNDSFVPRRSGSSPAPGTRPNAGTIRRQHPPKPRSLSSINNTRGVPTGVLLKCDACRLSKKKVRHFQRILLRQLV